MCVCVCGGGGGVVEEKGESILQVPNLYTRF